MNEINFKNYKELEQKHYSRMKCFIKYDIEDRSITEQVIILKQASKAINDLLANIKQ